jgi:arginase
MISVSIDLGAGRRGVDMGPSGLRIAGLTERLHELGHTVREIGSIHARELERVDAGDPRARYLDEILEVCTRTRDAVRRTLDEGWRPLVLGGDHSLSIGSVAAVAAHHAARGERIGVLWVDAHTDMNTPEITPSGNIHGMSLAVLNGYGPPELVGLWGGEGRAVQAEHVCVLGARDIDPAEAELVRQSGIRVFTMTEIDERGIGPCVDEALERLTDGTAGFHLSFDLDGLDPTVAPGVGTPVDGGLTYREGHLVCEKVARSEALLSLELVELNSVLDERNRTGRIGVEMLASALGASIL